MRRFFREGPGMIRRVTLIFLLYAGPLHASPAPMAFEVKSLLSDQTKGHLSITDLEAVCTLRGALARTTVTLTLSVDLPPMENPPRMEAVFSFYLPSHCVVTGASLDIGSTLRRASLTFKETAGAAYRSVVSRQLDPVLITMAPDGLVKVQIFPITPAMPRVVQLEFSQILTPSPEGLIWEFPLRFANPVSQAALTTDAPGLQQHGVSLRPDFAGGGEWTLTAPNPPAGGVWPAHPDETGAYLFQAVLPAGNQPPPPRHLLIVVDTSALQRDRDAASERKFLTELMARMGEGTVTLSTYDTLPGPIREFSVRNGICHELHQTLDDLIYDGAPRPGGLKLSHIQADLTVVIGSLQHPMDRYAWPELPKNAPVLVLDSVSSVPSTLALKLAGNNGGSVWNPRSPQPPVWWPRIPQGNAHFSDPTFYLLPDQSAWFVTAKLTGVNITAPEPGTPARPAKGSDRTAGELTTLHRGRNRLCQHLQDAPGSLRHALPPEWASSPVLSGRTGFIVLEELSQYAQFGISLPPDLAGQDPGINHPGAMKPRIDFECFARALTRTQGAPASIEEWRQQLAGWKFGVFTRDRQHLIRFQQHRNPMPSNLRGLEEYIGKELYRSSVRNLEEATRQIPQLTALYASAKTTVRADLIRRARILQQAKITMMEILDPEMWAGMFRSGSYSPSADPFSGPSTLEEAGMTRFFGASDVADDAGAVPFEGRSAESESQGAGTAASPGGMVEPVDPQETAEASSLANFTAAAQSLHREGRNAEALRTLSNLVAQPRPGHGALRFLAWQLIEWNELQAARNVLQQAHYLYGPTTVTLRDLALIPTNLPSSLSGDFETLYSLPLGVARREASSLQGRDPAALRILLECADENADADLEIEGPDFETASWQNPLPSFGGALSFDGRGFTPEDFVLASAPVPPLTVRVRLHGKKPLPVRVTIFRNWSHPDMKKQVFLLPACRPGLTEILEIPAS